MASEIIECEDVLNLFEADWRRLIAGEKKNAKLLYLVATSRLLSKTMHAAIKGPSAAGKSEVRARVLQFFPPESIVSFTSLSEKALIYFEDDFTNKILSMGEAAGTDEQSFQDYLLRELMSDGRLRYPVVQKGVEGMQTIVIEKTGPVAFLVTTTRRKLHPENETRMLSLEIDDSENQTRAVMSKVAEVEGLGLSAGSVDFTPWHDFQRWLAAGDREVVIPYAGSLADMVPSRAVRLRRDFGQVLRAIKAHALIHRTHRSRDDLGRIVADIDHDYATVRDLVHDLLQETAEAKIREIIVETVNAVSEATRSMTTDDGAMAIAIAGILKMDKSTAHRRLMAARDADLVENLETRKGKPGRYRVTGRTIETVEMLPDPEALRGVIFRKSVATVQPCNREAQSLANNGKSGCKSRLQPVCNPEPTGSGCNAVAKADCNRQKPEISKKNGTGCTVAVVASDLPEEKGKEAELDPVAELPDFLNRKWEAEV